ncbi:hypothetical protein OKW20_006159 [Ensifer sp. LBL]
MQSARNTGKHLLFIPRPSRTRAATKRPFCFASLKRNQCVPYTRQILTDLLGTDHKSLRDLRYRDKPLKRFTLGAGWSSPVARQAHNLKAAGSNPAPATKSKQKPAWRNPAGFCPF